MKNKNQGGIIFQKGMKVQIIGQKSILTLKSKAPSVGDGISRWFVKERELAIPKYHLIPIK